MYVPIYPTGASHHQAIDNLADAQLYLDLVNIAFDLCVG